MEPGFNPYSLLQASTEIEVEDGARLGVFTHTCTSAHTLYFLPKSLYKNMLIFIKILISHLKPG